MMMTMMTYCNYIYGNNNSDFFVLVQVLALRIIGNFPLFAANFNAGACKFDSVVSELIM
jgi:hypothetical protein